MIHNCNTILIILHFKKSNMQLDFSRKIQALSAQSKHCNSFLGVQWSYPDNHNTSRSAQTPNTISSFEVSYLNFELLIQTSLMVTLWMKNVDIIALKLTMPLVFIYVVWVMRILKLNFLKKIGFIWYQTKFMFIFDL